MTIAVTKLPYSSNGYDNLIFARRCVAGQVSRDPGPSRAVLSTSRLRYQEVPQPLTTEHLPATPHFPKGDLLCW